VTVQPEKFRFSGFDGIGLHSICFTKVVEELGHEPQAELLWKACVRTCRDRDIYNESGFVQVTTRIGPEDLYDKGLAGHIKRLEKKVHERAEETAEEIAEETAEKTAEENGKAHRYDLRSKRQNA
jgi:1-acyl-sn-glycerol-3-phosphate acyltransferase